MVFTSEGIDAPVKLYRRQLDVSNATPKISMNDSLFKAVLV